MTHVANLAELIARIEKAPQPFENLLEVAKELPAATSVESTYNGRQEFGRLVRLAKNRCQLENPYTGRPSRARVNKSGRGGVQTIPDERRLAPRPIAFDKLAVLIKRGSGVDISSDTLEKVCYGGNLTNDTMLRLLAAQFILHPEEDRAITSSEAIALLREETTIDEMIRAAGGTVSTRRQSRQSQCR